MLTHTPSTTRQRRHRQRCRHDRGSILLLFPAALLAMIVLGAMAIDVSYTTVRGRELQAVAASAANDSLAALDVQVLRTNGTVELNQTKARQIVAAAIARGPLPQARIVNVGIDGLKITVSLQLDVELVMAPALGNLNQITLTRTAQVVVIR
ncbi:MAG: pilus assembly protein TadG-related protein [Acidimicrobiaceae bacterium]|nr:pilus assembly protein TadG-related protein [Acidimicrobiaceae bacterium]